ncbi:MAG: site-specific DNA-methyltransferase [Dehalococcoidia bacterium]|nr:site-specific DNA-methyltransferase [Dehalococcoidia bacterium]
MKTNALYYGDNLDILRNRAHFPEECVDLIYLDPPFNSSRSYNVLFKESSGAASEAQIEAFEDTWHWGLPAERAYEQVFSGRNQGVARMLKAMVEGLGRNDVTAYLAMMAIRLVELHVVLKPTGSIYLHCDPTTGHYLKVIMDAVFDPRNFRNEVVWKRASTVKSNFGQGAKSWGPATDSILFYSKSDSYTFHQPFLPYSESYTSGAYRHVESGTNRRYRLVSMIGPGGAAKGNPQYDVMGVTRYWRYSKEQMERLVARGLVVQTKPGRVPHRKYYLDEGQGVPLQSLWTDIGNLQAPAKERIGYPTQKPLALLERIIDASSNAGDIVLDPFCGCGTAVQAAQALGRRWIGIDITHLAIGLVRRRMQDAFPGIEIEVIGEPKDLAGARDLAAMKPKQFEYWVVDKLDAVPTGGTGPDLDGVKPFMEFGGKGKRAVISVKGTKVVNPEMIREVAGSLGDDKPIGILATLVEPTRGMKTQAAAAGFYESGGRKYQRLQTISVKEILEGKRPDLPSPASPFSRAPVEREKAQQDTLL